MLCCAVLCGVRAGMGVIEGGVCVQCVLLYVCMSV